MAASIFYRQASLIYRKLSELSNGEAAKCRASGGSARIRPG